MLITDALLGEHGVFYAQFDLLERDLPRETSLDRMKSQAGLLEAALGSHARIENELLFSSLDPAFGGMGPLVVMRHEHDAIEGGLAAVQDEGDLGRARDRFLETIETARAHFAKEEQILFPMARQALGGDGLARLGAEWAERRRVAAVGDAGRGCCG